MIDWLVASERDGDKLNKVGSRKSCHGRSVVVRDVAVNIVEEKIAILHNEDGFVKTSLKSINSITKTLRRETKKRKKNRERNRS